MVRAAGRGGLSVSVCLCVCVSVRTLLGVEIPPITFFLSVFVGKSVKFWVDISVALCREMKKMSYEKNEF